MAGSAELLRAYLIVGADELKRDHALSRLKGRVPEGLREFNLDEREVRSDSDPADLLASLSTMPFGADFRLVIIANGDHLPKPVSECIVSYLDNPNPSVVLCVVATSLTKGTRLYKAISRQGTKSVIDCTPKKRWELPSQVRAMAPSHGKTITQDAAEELVSRVGESTLMLDKQLATLATMVGSRDPITLGDVEQFVARTAEVRPWDFLDAVCERDAARAAQLLALMGSTSPVALQSLLTTRLRELICAKALDSRGCGSMLASELGRQAWQVKNYVRWSRNFSMEELISALAGSAACERTLKGTGDSSLALLVWVMSIARPQTRKRAS